MKKKSFISIIATILTIVMVATSIFVINYNKKKDEIINLFDDVPDTELKEGGYVVGLDGLTKDEYDLLYSEKENDNNFLLKAIANIKEETKPVSDVEELKHYEKETINNTPYDLLYPEEFGSGLVEYSQNSILIKFKTSNNTNVNNELRNAGIGKLVHSFDGEDYAWYVAYLTKEANINETMTKVRNIDSVIVAEYNFKYETTADISEVEYVSKNELVTQQDHLNSMGIIDSWSLLDGKGINPGGKRSITIAVIDTGVDYNHEDLKDNMWINANEIPNDGIDNDNNGYVDDYYGVDIIAGHGSGMDDHGHGTHVAGIVAATNNNSGVVGIAYNSKVMAIKAGDASGYFALGDIANAIIYAFDNGADVINMSFGGAAWSNMVQDALETAYSRSVLVAAAGNSGLPNEETDNYRTAAPNYPANYPFVLGVMSCGTDGVGNFYESSFSCWDALLFNSNEYEVYAIGEGVLSTLPGNKYGKLSGTSMASPIVASQAALLRSYYSDLGTYPTKFIYGQISGTADKIVKCWNEEKHSVNGNVHNVPGIVNFSNSITNLPSPMIGISDYSLFDSENFSADVNGIADTSKNNGDGVVDAGETIALGFTIRNRWGMSKNTTVHVSAENDLGVKNPYVTILNNDLNYGSIGTYSEQDSGKIYNNDMWIGWENPIYVKIADSCPNNYHISLRIQLSCENGLNEQDNNSYSSSQDIELVVRRGTVLPNKIKDDMTLTSDNYYIIPNSTMVMEGATLTIEKGTKIQFWCSDPSDSYADTSIAYLQVNGKLVCNGTEDEPIEMFPSDWMSEFRVEIYQKDQGHVTLKHTNIANPYLDIDEAYNCEFTQVYPRRHIKYRYLNGSEVRETVGSGSLKASLIKNCSFYKLGGGYSTWGFDVGDGHYDGCAFIDSSIYFENSIYAKTKSVFENCVFYGNNNFNQGIYEKDQGATTSLTLNPIYQGALIVNKVFADNQNKKTYVVFKTADNISISKNYDILKSFANMYGFDFVKFETENEFDFVVGNVDYGERYYIDKAIMDENWDWKNRIVSTYDESVFLKKDLLIYSSANQYDDKELTLLYDGSDYVSSYGIFEIPNVYFAEDIKLREYITTIDSGSTYQIQASISPAEAASSKLLYESENNNIIEVDENGLVTAISFGTARVKVSSTDGAIYNYVTINVMPTVELESFSIEGLNNNTLALEVGDNFALVPLFNPSNTTMRKIECSIGNDGVISLTDNGYITANKVGETTVVLRGENNKEFSFSVVVTEKVEYIPAESISFRIDSYNTDLRKEEYITRDKIALNYYIYPENASNKQVIWESSNPDVCYVNEEGNIVKLAAGSSTLRARIKDTDLYDDLTVTVVEGLSSVFVTKAKLINDVVYAVTDNNELYKNGTYNNKLLSENVVDVFGDSTNSSVVDVLLSNGDLNKYNTQTLECTEFLHDVVYVSSANGLYDKSSYAIKEDGTIWAWGNNDCGQLGTGNLGSSNDPIEVKLNSNIVKIVSYHHSVTDALTGFLDNSGNLYISGTSETITTPVLKYQNVKDIYQSNSGIFIINNDGSSMEVSSSAQHDSAQLYDEKTQYSPRFDYYIENGKAYVRAKESSSTIPYALGLGNVTVYWGGTYMEEFHPMININDAKEIIAYQGYKTLILTENGKVYLTGYFDAYTGPIERTKTPTLVNIGNNSSVSTGVVVKTHNICYGALYNDQFVLDYNIAISEGTYYNQIEIRNASGSTLAIEKSFDFNHISIAPKDGFVENETYKVVIPENAFVSATGSGNERFEMDFTYHSANINFSKDFYELSEIKQYNNIFNQSVEYSANYVLNWTSSNEEVLSVDGNGNLIAHKQGYAIITATIDGTNVSDSAYVFVNNPNFEIISSNVAEGIFNGEVIRYKLNMPISDESDLSLISLVDKENNATNISVSVTGDELRIKLLGDLVDEKEYYLSIPSNSLKTLTSNCSFTYEENLTYKKISLEIIGSNTNEWILNTNTLELTFSLPISSSSLELITVDGYVGDINYELVDEKLSICFNNELNDAGHYTLVIPENTLVTSQGDTNTAISFDFVYEDLDATHQSIKDTELHNERLYAGSRYVTELWQAYKDSNYNYQFHSNAIINRMSNDDVRTWFRVSSGKSDNYKSIPLGYNYWGTTNEELIKKQILDFDIYASLIDLDESEYLVEAPSNTFPFVVDAYLTVDGQRVDSVGNETVVFVVKFNRAMDTEYGLNVTFGSSYPYGDYEVEGSFKDETTWSGEVTLKTLIENGYQYFSISNGRTAADEAGEHLKLYEDWGRFPFKIDTSNALALTMFAEAYEEGIKLRWVQDDFDTLAGYNVYRSTSEDGFYTKLNKTVIPTDTKEWFDTTVEPGVRYYYNFTVVQTDFTESEPSGKVVATSFDTMPPNIYHSPVSLAYTNSNLIISATITDNVAINGATLYYRTTGTENWLQTPMLKNMNDKYTGVIYSEYVTLEGIEYYIDAYDGVKHTSNGNATEPYFITIQQQIELSSMGDVDGNGEIEILDALLVLQAINDRVNLSSDQFYRADLNRDGTLSSAEALKIVKYVNGSISNLLD